MKPCVKCGSTERLRPTVRDPLGRCRPCDAAYRVLYRSRNTALCLSYTATWRGKNRDHLRAYDKARPSSDAVFRSARRHAAKLQRSAVWCPQWLMRLYYDACPDGFEVDHIVPMQGKMVSGLHVSWNLQYLTPKKNREKGNKYAVSCQEVNEFTGSSGWPIQRAA